MPRPKKQTTDVSKDILKELEELTQIRDTQPVVISISHNPSGTIIGVDKDGKLWRYDDWAKLWRAVS